MYLFFAFLRDTNASQHIAAISPTPRIVPSATPTFAPVLKLSYTKLGCSLPLRTPESIVGRKGAAAVESARREEEVI